MPVPLCARAVAAVIGGLLVLAAWTSAIETLHVVERLRAVDFPIERDPAQAWPDFVGWRVTYEQAAYAVADP